MFLKDAGSILIALALEGGVCIHFNSISTPRILRLKRILNEGKPKSKANWPGILNLQIGQCNQHEELPGVEGQIWVNRTVSAKAIQSGKKNWWVWFEQDPEHLDKLNLGNSPRSFQSRPNSSLEAGVKERQTRRVFFDHKGSGSPRLCNYQAAEPALWE